MDATSFGFEWQVFVEKLPIAAMVYDKKNLNILMLNRAFIELLGYSQTAFKNMNDFLALVCPDPTHRERLTSIWMENMDRFENLGTEAEDLDVVLMTRTRNECCVRIQLIQEPEFTVVLLTDMTAFNEMESELKRANSTDYLTGLPNRKSFANIMAKQIDHCRRYREDITLLVMDLDNFSRINEEFGCEAGDRVIIMVTDAIQECIRSCDFISRIAGETYGLLLPTTDENGAVVLAERIRKTISELELNMEDGSGQKSSEWRVTISIGIAYAYKGMVKPDQMMQRAEQALKEAKSLGKDRIVLQANQMIP